MVFRLNAIIYINIPSMLCIVPIWVFKTCITGLKHHIIYSDKYRLRDEITSCLSKFFISISSKYHNILVIVQNHIKL